MATKTKVEYTPLALQPATRIDVVEAWKHVRQTTLMRLGAKDMVYSQDSGYVRFTTSGVKRVVTVKLAADDTYSVEIGRVVHRRGRHTGAPEYRVLRQITGMDAYGLASAIESEWLATT